jgi:[protein-PII] uridylyltransferase
MLRLSPHILEARRQLAEGREKLKSQHGSGALGIQLSASLTSILDQVVLSVYRAAIDSDDIPADLQSQVTLVAHGGYGRRDVAPFSDVDLMLLYHPGAGGQVHHLARRLVQDVSDVGVDLGFSLRTPQEACQLAARDPIIFTALVESRWLAGSVPLMDRFLARFRRLGRRHRSLVRSITASRQAERRKFGETVYLLEPNVKRSQGTLRDIHLLRWIGYAKYGEAEPDRLCRMGLLSAEDHHQLRAALEFLLKVRNDLHFHANASQDVLYRSEQVRLAELYGYSGTDALLPVERFMQEYFRHTSEIRDVVAHFVAAANWHVPWRHTLHAIVGHHIERDFLAGPAYISCTRRGREKVRGNLDEVLRLMDLANRYNAPIDHASWEVIRESMTSHSPDRLSHQASQRFLSLLSQPGRLGNLLRRLHELRVLEKLVPGFDHARCLLQFNEYHKYTVDEHSFRAVERATEFLHDDGLLGNVYRSIPDKTVLHLALLIHDVGKGFAEDHCEVGQQIANRVAGHLNLPDLEAERLAFLVHRHLLLNHLAFRRDNSDPAVVLEAAAEIGSPANLKMLFILSCADLAAVGPDVLNPWKIEVLGDLYHRIMDTLSGGALTTDTEYTVRARRAELRTAVADDPQRAWLTEQIDSLPAAYLTGAAAADVLDDLRRLRELPRKGAVAWGRYLPQQEVIEYSIGADEHVTTGIFHRLTGVLTSQRLQILSAEIHSLAGSLILDRFYVQDLDFSGPPPADRFADVSQRMVDALCNPSYSQPVFRQVWQAKTDRQSTALRRRPTQVLVDNSTSDRFTILDVFTQDRTGLLYAIARSLYELGLSVNIAKIATYVDQVVDVFYVTDMAGAKIRNERRLGEIRTTLTAAIESWQRESVES